MNLICRASTENEKNMTALNWMLRKTENHNDIKKVGNPLVANRRVSDTLCWSTLKWCHKILLSEWQTDSVTNSRTFQSCYSPLKVVIKSGKFLLFSLYTWFTKSLFSKGSAKIDLWCVNGNLIGIKISHNYIFDCSNCCKKTVWYVDSGDSEIVLPTRLVIRIS